MTSRKKDQKLSDRRPSSSLIKTQWSKQSRGCVCRCEFELQWVFVFIVHVQQLPGFSHWLLSMQCVCSYSRMYHFICRQKSVKIYLYHRDGVTTAKAGSSSCPWGSKYKIQNVLKSFKHKVGLGFQRQWWLIITCNTETIKMDLRRAA